MIDVGKFVAWESPTSGITYKGRVRERLENDDTVVLRIIVAGPYETEGDAVVPESACRVLMKKANP
jgi:hypothetical protein